MADSSTTPPWRAIQESYGCITCKWAVRQVLGREACCVYPGNPWVGNYKCLTQEPGPSAEWPEWARVREWPCQS
jgi:hypothetical protein